MAWNQVQKIFANQICFITHKKCSNGNKKKFANKICSKSNKRSYTSNEKCSQWELLHMQWNMISKWPYKTKHGFERPIMVLYSLLWSFMILNGTSSYCLAFLSFFYVQNIDLIGLELSFPAVINPNSIGLVCCCFSRNRWFVKLFCLGYVAGPVTQAYGRIEFEDVLNLDDRLAATEC